MHKQAFTFCVTGCRSQLVSWIMLIVLLCSLAPSLSFAQQPTVTITSLSGTVLVNGQTGSPGTILNAGDAIETQANASVVLQFSDGSQMELGESTQLDLAELIETDTGARVSKVKLAWGWLQAHLSAGHQKEGSKFDVETPNALVGVKFSDPKFFINHDLQERATEVKALTVALDVLNRVTGEQIVVPVGSTAIITSLGTQLIAGATSGILSAKTVVIGAGTLALVGGGVALATSGSGSDSGSDSNNGDGSDSTPFTGTFRWETPCGMKREFSLAQTGNNIHGGFIIYLGEECYATYSVNGHVINENTATLTLTLLQGACPDVSEGTLTVTLTETGLYVEEWGIELPRV